jgi:signal transduction histidine kinase
VPFIDMSDYTDAARRYWWSLALLGAGALAYSVAQLTRLEEGALAMALAGGALAAFVGVFPVSVPRTKTLFVGGDIIIFFVLLAYGAPAAVLAAALEAMVGSLRGSKRWTSRLGSPVMAAIGMSICGFAFDALRRSLAPGDAGGALLLLVTLTGGVYFAFNVSLPNALFALKKREPIAPHRWMYRDRVLFLWYVGCASIAGGLYLSFQHFGPQVVLLSAPVIAMFMYTLHTLERLDVANQHKSEFLANMSHELRTPLNAMILGAEILRDGMAGGLTREQVQIAAEMHQSGEHLLTLINDILDMSKIEAGRMEIYVVPLDIARLVGSAAGLMKESAARHGIRLATDVDPALGAIAADERKVKQILLNLLSNAIKFTPDGGAVTVSARRAAGGIEIAVADTGVGIAKVDHDLVFEAFRQAAGEPVRKSEGTGLGLALARRFAELHGGWLRLESAPGSGSTFTVFLPENAAPTPPAAARSPATSP